MTDVRIPGASSADELVAHLAVPAVGDGPWPGVVVVHEAFGLNDDIRSHADRFAAAGYLAVAPDLYTAGGTFRCLRATFRTMIAGHGPAFDDLEAARRFLLDRAECSGKVGVIGFCLGGGFALVAATRGFDVSAPNYARVPADAEEALRGACPVVASYGARDRAFRGTAARLEGALEALGVEHDVKEYDHAGHSFLNRHNVGQPLTALQRVAGLGYQRASAEDAWRRIFVFFDRHLR